MLSPKISKRSLGWTSGGSAYGLIFMGIFLASVSDVSCKKYNANATSSSTSSDTFGYSNVVSSTLQAKNDSTAEASSSSATNAFVGTGRQARDSSSSYSVPAQSSGGYSNNQASAAGGYSPTYAMPPIIMQHGGGGWGMTGSGWGSEDDGDFGGEDLKSLIGLLGLFGLKGLKPLKALKVIKGLGLLALAPFAPILLPLLPLLLLAPLLLPLLLLFLPIPVISIPGGRRKRDLSGNGKISTSKTLLQETIDDIMSQIPPDFAQLRWKDVDQCMEKFMCDTGVMVSQVAPSMASPAAWLLATLWPAQLQSKVETFRKVTEMMKHNKNKASIFNNNFSDNYSSRNSFYYSYNMHPAKRSNGLCQVNYKCRVKKLENLFHKLVVEQTEKLKDKLAQRIPPGEISPATVFRALLT